VQIRRPHRFLLALAVAAAGLAGVPARAFDLVEENGFRVPEGFGVQLYADDAMAHDISCVTVDPHGRVVVSGPGYIKTLIPDEAAPPQSPKAARAVTFSTVPKSGAQGLCFVGSDLYASGDGAVWKFRDADGDGVADGPPEKFIDGLKAGGEHGVHSIVQGPDGWLYIIGGDGSGIASKLNTIPSASIKSSLGGAILRVSPDGKQRELIAHGFRNPYALCFNALGSIFAWDSDGERVEHLPGYRPCSLFHVSRGRHHGWVNAVPGNPFSRPWHWIDVVDPMIEIGRGSPTGMVCYRHRQFPEEWGNGIFYACWTFGRIYYCKPARMEDRDGADASPTPTGPSYSGEKQIFLESAGNQGFAPSGLAIGRDGALYVASGGRGTKGSVYRVAHKTNEIHGDPEDEVELVLAADQPDASWSRKEWVAQAKELGAKRFESWLLRDSVGMTPLPDIRALEVLTELFGGVSVEVAKHISAKFANDPGRMEAGRELLARLPWTAERNPRITSERDRNEHYLRVGATAGMQGHRAVFECILMQKGTLLRGDEEDPSDGDTFASHVDAIRRGANAGDPDRVPLLNMRTLVVAGGDVLLSREAQWQDGYQTWFPLKIREEVERNAAWWTDPNPHAAYEYARLVAMTQAEPEGFWQSLPGKWTVDSDVRDDLHYLFVAASRVEPHAKAQPLADAWLRLHHKLRAGGQSPSRMWPQFVEDAFDDMLRQTPALADAIVSSSQLSLPEHALFVAKLDGDVKRKGVLKLTATVKDWTPELVQLTREVLAGMDAAGKKSLIAKLSALADDARLRDAVLPVLCDQDSANEAQWARRSLASFNPKVAERGVTYFLVNHGEGQRKDVLADLVKMILRFDGRKDVQDVSGIAKTLVATALSPDTKVRLQLIGGTASVMQSALLDKYPDLSASFPAAPGLDLAREQTRWSMLDVDEGNPARGKVIYEQRLCARCHSGNARMGPDLKGVAQRWSVSDLFLHVADPNRQISPAWKGERFVLRDGREFNGVAVYDSPAGMLVQVSPDETVRITGAELKQRLPSDISLMPPALLQGLSDAALADLHAYLRTMK
jgi:putative heme-binding domain-containing protein